MYTQTKEGLGQTPQVSPASQASGASLVQKLREALASGQWYLALTLAVLLGDRDENRLTNMIFFARHPERGGRKLDPSEPNFKQFSREWLDIRNRLVRPAVQGQSVGPAPGVTSTTSVAAAMPRGPFGILTATVPGRSPFKYVFTPEDTLWTARFIKGEAGGRDDRDNRAVIWAMFNRYALFTHRYYPTFHQFIRAYSTPLQPVLKSWGAAKRHMHKPEFVRTGGYYSPPHNDIPRGQLRRFLTLQATPWNQLPNGARSLAEQALKGQVPNPIGLASEFGSTYVYFHDKHSRYPNDDEWRRYSQAYAQRKGWVWIGPVLGLNQKKNAFFVQKQVAGLSPDTVHVVPPS